MQIKGFVFFVQCWFEHFLQAKQKHNKSKTKTKQKQIKTK
jgi:hypothetical protein